MRLPNPAIRLPSWRWLQRFDRWRCGRGILTDRWMQDEINEHRRLARAHRRALLTFSDCPEDPDF